MLRRGAHRALLSLQQASHAYRVGQRRKSMALARSRTWALHPLTACCLLNFASQACAAAQLQQQGSFASQVCVSVLGQCTGQKFAYYAEDLPSPAPPAAQPPIFVHHLQAENNEDAYKRIAGDDTRKHVTVCVSSTVTHTCDCCYSKPPRYS